MQAFTHHRVLLAFILGTVASASAQGIINKSAYIPAPEPRVRKASPPVSTPTLHVAGSVAAAPPKDGAATPQQPSQSAGSGAEPPEMRLKSGKAQAPKSAKLDPSTKPQQRIENATLKQRAHNDSIPHQRKREDSIPKQRQLNVSLPAQRKPDDLLPKKQPGGKTLHASAPSGTPPSGKTEGGKQEADLPSPGGPSDAPQGNFGLQTGAPEAAAQLQSTGSVAPGPQLAAAVPVSKPMQFTAGQEALRELLGEAAAAPAQHSTAGSRKAPASRYAAPQGMREGYFDVWPAPAPCQGFYNVRAQSEQHSSQESTDEAPRYSTRLAVSGAAAVPLPSITGGASAAPSAESDHVQAHSPQSLAEIPLSAVSPSEGDQDVQELSDKPSQPSSAASAPSTEANRALQPQEVFLSRSESAPALTPHAAAPEQATPAQAPQQITDMYGQSISIQALQPELAEYGAYAPGPGTEPAALDLDLLSAVYNAGYRAGYESARTELTEPVKHSHTTPLATSPQPSKEHPKVPGAVSMPLRPSQPSFQSQQVRSQPQAYGSYGGAQPSDGEHKSESPSPTGNARQGTPKAAAPSPEAIPAQARHRYGNHAPAYGYQSYAYQGYYSKTESQKLLQATAHEQAASFGKPHFITSAGADAEAPGPGPGIATQSFAAAPVVRSYPGEQQPASPAQAAAPAPSYIYEVLPAQSAQEMSLAPAPSTSLAPVSAPAYSGLPAHEAASAPAGTYRQQPPPAYALQPVLPPTTGPEDASAQPSQAPSISAPLSYGYSALAAYAPGPQPSSAPTEALIGGRPVTVAPAPAPSTAADLAFRFPLPYAPAAAPAAYAPVPAVSPSAYGAFGPAASMPGVAPSGNISPVLAPSAGVSRFPVSMPSAAPLAAPCEVCHRPEGGASHESAAPEVVLNILDGSELAQYVTQEGSNANVVYFVAEAAFSRPPTNFTGQDVTVANGTAVDVISEGTCGRFLVKGYVEAEQSAGGNGTAVALSIKAGTLRDCAGNMFPAASATGTVSDRPTGMLQAPDLGVDKNVSASGEPQVFLTLTFSQPVLSVSPADIRVYLTQSFAQGAKNDSSVQGQSGTRRSLAEDASGCVPEAIVRSSSPREAQSGASKAYTFIVGLSSCFRGKVAVEYMGSAQTPKGVASFPVKPFSFWHPTGPRMGQAHE